jgi:hypothetical protein
MKSLIILNLTKIKFNLLFGRFYIYYLYVCHQG